MSERTSPNQAGSSKRFGSDYLFPTKPEDIAITLAEANNAVRRLGALVAIERHKATHDHLTGLYNKSAWKARLAEQLKSGKPLGLAFVDLDGFKRVNDTLGHERGDQLLAEFGQFLTEKFKRQEDFLTHETLINKEFEKPDDGDYHSGRLGGDEFGFIFGLEPNDRRGSNISENADHELGYLRSVFQEFVASQDEQVRSCNFDVSVGVAIFDPDNPVSMEELLHQADQNMYLDKNGRRAAR